MTTPPFRWCAKQVSVSIGLYTKSGSSVHFWPSSISPMSGRKQKRSFHPLTKNSNSATYSFTYFHFSGFYQWINYNICSINIFRWDNFNILYSYMLYHLCKTICLFILLCIAKIMILFSMMLFICISLIFIVVIVIFVFIRSLMKNSSLLIFYTWINML